MAEGIGVDGIHCVSGVCDLCGDACDANTQELNVLTCTFKNCDDLPYHQDCLEKYLKSIRLERNRKTGFKCPRGCGKGTAHKDPCPGKIDKSHPIHPRNEEQKKKKKAKLPEVLVAPPARQVKIKEEKKQEKAAAKAAAAAAAAAAAPADKAKAAKTTAASAASAAPANNGVKARPPLPPDPKAKLAEAVAAARRELAAGKQPREATPPAQPAPAALEYKTLDMYYKENAASSSSLSSMSSAAAAAPPVANAWAAKPPVPAPPAAALGGGSSKQQQKPAAAAATAAAAGPSRLHVAYSAHSLQSAHSTHSTDYMRADSPTSLLPPPPPPPPPPHHAATAAADQHGNAASLQPHGSSSSLQSGGGAVGANGQLPVGMEYLADEEQTHLTKAQRKNLKRAEKKKKGGTDGISSMGGADGDAAAGTGSDAAGGEASSASTNAAASSSAAAATGGKGGAAGGGAAAAGAAAAASSSSGGGAAGQVDTDDDSSSLMYELAVQALLANKTLALVASLQRLGFTEWQAAAAVQRHGSDLEEGVAWLLEGGAPSPEAATAAAGSGCVAEVSINEELSLMEQLVAAMPLIPRHKLYQTVADTGGDLDAAAAVCLQYTGLADDMDAAAGLAAGDGESEYGLGLMASDAGASSSQQIASQQVASSDVNVLDAVTGSVGGFDSAGVYSASGAAAAAVGSSLATADTSFSGWLGESSQFGSQLPSSSYGLTLPSAAGGAAAGSLGFLQSAGLGTAGTALGSSSIWATSDQPVSSSLWAAGAGSSMSLQGSLAADAGGSLFGPGGSGLGGLGGLGNGNLCVGVEAPGLGLLNSQQSLSASDPVLESFGNGGMFASAGSDAASGAGAAGPGLQQSRLFQSYGWRQQPLFGGAEQQQQQQQQVPNTGAGVHAAADDEADLEGLMATLMCH